MNNSQFLALINYIDNRISLQSLTDINTTESKLKQIYLNVNLIYTDKYKHIRENNENNRKNSYNQYKR